MGEANRKKAAGHSPETREPKEPVNWPHGHVAVELTGDDENECICVTIHGRKHYLHSTTFAALLWMGDQKLAEWLALRERTVAGLLGQQTQAVEQARKGDFS